jgi:GH25 family lysozyme M1 (1,4-beta-N-acetylmuramidase)
MPNARFLSGGVCILLFSCAPMTPQEVAETTEALCAGHTTSVEGIDVSEFQGANIDWTMVHNSGRQFAIARIGDGAYMDADFARNYAGIASAGMIRGAYLFWRPQVTAAAQFATITTAVPSLGPGDLPPTIDVECMCPFHTGGLCGSTSYSDCVDSATAAARIHDLYNMLEAHYGRPPMIYTGAWFWDGGTYLNGALQLPSAPLWLSGYVSGCPPLPSGWTDWVIWQYSDGAAPAPSVPGVPGDGGDRNRWNGDMTSLMAFTGGGGTTTPTYGAAFVMQSFPYASAPPIQIPQGQTLDAWIDLRNIGTATWDGSTCLGTTVARDRVSPFASAGWVNDHRLDCVPAGMTVAPGATHRFSWTWSVPATQPLMTYDEHYDLVQEGVTWFGDALGPPDTDIEAMIEVTAGVDSGVPNDAYVAPRDANVAHDAGAGSDGSTSHGDGSTTLGDGGASPVHMLSGGCGCSLARANHHGAWLLMIVLAAFASRRARRA